MDPNEILTFVRRDLARDLQIEHAHLGTAKRVMPWEPEWSTPSHSLNSPQEPAGPALCMGCGRAPAIVASWGHRPGCGFEWRP